LLDQFAFVGAFLVIVLVFGVTPPILAFLACRNRSAPHEPEIDEREQSAPDKTPDRFKQPHYTLAVTFVLSYVEAAFLLPWALAHDALNLHLVLETIIFILILFAGLAYTWHRAPSEWRRLQKLGRHRNGDVCRS
jgi:NADH:ubiquinone oxidoreductase subunit 3 (subunit A)